MRADETEHLSTYDRFSTSHTYLTLPRVILFTFIHQSNIFPTLLIDNNLYQNIRISKATSIRRNRLFSTHTLFIYIHSLNFMIVYTHNAIQFNIIICIRYIIDKRFVSFVFLFAFLPVLNLFCKHMSIYLAENYCLLQLYIK